MMSFSLTYCTVKTFQPPSSLPRSLILFGYKIKKKSENTRDAGLGVRPFMHLFASAAMIALLNCPTYSYVPEVDNLQIMM